MKCFRILVHSTKFACHKHHACCTTYMLLNAKLVVHCVIKERLKNKVKVIKLKMYL